MLSIVLLSSLILLITNLSPSHRPYFVPSSSSDHVATFSPTLFYRALYCYLLFSICLCLPSSIPRLFVVLSFSSGFVFVIIFSSSTPETLAAIYPSELPFVVLSLTFCFLFVIMFSSSSQETLAAIYPSELPFVVLSLTFFFSLSSCFPQSHRLPTIHRS